MRVCNQFLSRLNSIRQELLGSLTISPFSFRSPGELDRSLLPESLRIKQVKELLEDKRDFGFNESLEFMGSLFHLIDTLTCLLNGIKLTEHFCKTYEMLDCLNVKVF